MTKKKWIFIIILIVLILFLIFVKPFKDKNISNKDNINNVNIGSCIISDATKGHIQGYDYGIVYSINDDKPNDGFCVAQWKIKGNTQQQDFYGSDYCNIFKLILC